MSKLFWNDVYDMFRFLKNHGPLQFIKEYFIFCIGFVCCCIVFGLRLFGIKLGLIYELISLIVLINGPFTRDILTEK